MTHEFTPDEVLDIFNLIEALENPKMNGQEFWEIEDEKFKWDYETEGYGVFTKVNGEGEKTCEVQCFTCGCAMGLGVFMKNPVVIDFLTTWNSTPIFELVPKYQALYQAFFGTNDWITMKLGTETCLEMRKVRPQTVALYLREIMGETISLEDLKKEYELCLEYTPHE